MKATVIAGTLMLCLALGGVTGWFAESKEPSSPNELVIEFYVVRFEPTTPSPTAIQWITTYEAMIGESGNLTRLDVSTYTEKLLNFKPGDRVRAKLSADRFEVLGGCFRHQLLLGRCFRHQVLAIGPQLLLTK